MTVRLVDEIEEAERARLVLKAVQHDPEPEVPAPPKPTRPGRFELMEAMGVLARILGFRAQLFAGFVAAAVLSGWALASGGILPLVAASLFDVLVFAPLAYLAFRKG